MLFQIWLTIVVIAAVLLGMFWLLIRRPLLRRIKLEAEIAEEERLCEQQRTEARTSAERELATLLDVPQAAEQEEQQLQERRDR